MNSIRRFLVIVLLAIIVLSNFTAALRGYLSSMDEAEALFNQRLQQQVDLLNYALPGLLNRDNTSNSPLTFVHDDSSQTSLEFQLITSTGKVIAHSSTMPTHPISELEQGFSHTNFNGYRWHLLVSPSSSVDIWYVLAERDDQRYRLAETMILQAVYPMVTAIPLIGIIIWLVIGFGLKPIAVLAQELRHREATDLSPIVAQEMPIELIPLTQSANELLHRLEASFAREKRFSGDAAHELRTPLAALNIHCDNLLQEVQPVPESALKVKQGIERMGYLVEQILMLNRTAPDHFMGNFSPVNITQLIKNTITEQSFAIEEKKHNIEFDGDICWVLGDPLALETLLSNLLGNAIKYTPSGGHLGVSTWLKNDKVVVELMDSGPGIPEDQYQRVFDRFYRVGGDRHQSQTAGCGLGLPIAKQVADLHGADIQLSPTLNGKGLLVSVILKAFTPSANDFRTSQKNLNIKYPDYNQ